MNQAYLNITVRVASQQALAAYKQLQKETRGLAAAGQTAQRGMAPLDKVFRNSGLEKFGKNLQWTGRQLEFNFTLPLAIAGIAAGKWANENEAAMVRVRKVYGDGSKAMQVETAALAKSFELLSSRFGVHQQEVIDIGAAWAQAGSAGRGLAESVKTTLQTMILGEMDATKATEGLIAIQSAYRLNTKELRQELAYLNVIENTTSISFAGLIDVVSRAGGSARSAGIDLRHLAAMAATLVPTTGSAAQAGNALRTMISRIMAPTKDSAEVMALMGINIKETSWQALNGVQRIEKLAGAFDKLTQPQKNSVSALIASRWQINRFDILMGDVVKTLGTYGTALDATKSPTKSMAAFTRELTIYLSSQPQAFKMLTTQLQNAMARAIIPMLPAIVALLARITELAKWFSNLSPEVQQLSIAFLVALALIGPITRYIGALSLLGSVAGKAMGFLAIMFSKKAAASVVAAAADAAHTGEMHGMALAAARLNVVFHNVIASLWGFLTLPFKAVGMVMGLMWRATILGGQGAVMAIGYFWRGLVMLAGKMPAIGGLMARMWTVVATAAGTAFAFIQRVAIATVLNIDKVWRTVPVLFGIIGQGMSLVMVKSFTFMQSAALVAGSNIIKLWRTLPLIAGVIGPAITFAFIRASTLVQAGWAIASQAMVTMWRTLPLFAAVAGRAISIALMSPGVIATGIRTVLMGFGQIFMQLPAMAAVAGRGILAALMSPWALVIGAVILLAYMFRNQIGDAVNWVMKKFQQLPAGISGTLTNVIAMVKRFAAAVADWLSYLNPFARHSPSLVDNVRAGVSVIIDEYNRLAPVTKAINEAAKAQERFRSATSGGLKSAKSAERSDQRKDILKFSPNAGSALEDMYQQIDKLEATLPGLEKQIEAQEKVVRDLSNALDDANLVMDASRDRLDKLRDKASDVARELDTAKEVLQDLSNTPIAGMRAMEDQIFSNEMAQKKLRLEIMRMEDAAGGPLDELRDKMAKLQGDIETLSGQRTDLRFAGAGSDILSTYDDQISALEKQRTATQNLVKPIADAEKALAKLQREGERLDLQNSITFDPQLRQIEQMVKNLKEMPFADIVKGIETQNSKIKELEDSQKKVVGQVEAEEDALRLAEEVRDRIATKLDVEREKLDGIRNSYQDTTNSIRDMEGAIRDFTSAAAAANEKASSIGEDLFKAGAGVDFPVPGGTGGIGREGGIDEIEKFNKEMESELEDAMQSMGKLDMFGPFKDMWNKGWSWVRSTIGPKIAPITAEVKSWWTQTFSGIKFEGDGLLGWFDGFSGLWAKVGDQLKGTPLKTAFDNVSSAFGRIIDVGTTMVNFFIDTVYPQVLELVGWFVDAGKNLWDELKEWGKLFDPFAEAIGHVYAVLSWTMDKIWLTIQLTLAVIIAAWAIAWPILVNVVKPIFDGIVSLIKAALQILRGVIMFILAVINGDWKLAWEGIATILSGVWNGMETIVRTVFGVIYGVIKGTIESIVLIFRFLWDHSLGPIFNSLMSSTEGIWGKIAGVIRGGVNLAITAINFLIKGINKISDLVPGVDFHINEISHLAAPSAPGQQGTSTGRIGGVPLMAAGGRIPETDKYVRGGFATSMPRAVVGEGNPLYPEYVVPTDPAHRNRAIGLWAALGRDLGAASGTGSHRDEMGGWGPIGSVWDKAKSIGGDVLGKLRRGAVTAAFAGPLRLFDMAADRIPWSPIRQMAKAFKNNVYNWAKGVNDSTPEMIAGNEAIPGNGWQAIRNWFSKNTDVPFRVTSTFRKGDPGKHGAGLAVDFAGLTPGMDSPALLAINRALLPIAGTLNELIYAGPGGMSFKNGVPNAYSALVRADHHDHVHAALAAGGRLVVGRRPGGTLLRVGEGRWDEEVQVKPLRRGDTGGGDTVLNFYGDLEFPNITSGEDAESFVRNLENMS